MREGTLSFNFGLDRYEIAFDEGGRRKELHCGDTLEVQVKGEWRPTRVEFGGDEDDWYFVGIKNDDWSAGSRVRV